MKHKVIEEEIRYIQTQTLATLKIEGLKPSKQAFYINYLFSSNIWYYQ